MSFSPADLSTYHAAIELRSNDPDEDPLLIDLHGIGVVEGAGPVAVCDVNPPSVFAGMESTTWVGSGSYDPDGYAIVNYGWRLAEKPAGSNSVMPPCTDQADCGPFVPDVPGNYGAEPISMQFLPAHGRKLQMFFPCDDGLVPCRRAVIKNMISGALRWDRTISHHINAADSPEFFDATNKGLTEALMCAVVHWSE